MHKLSSRSFAWLALLGLSLSRMALPAQTPAALARWEPEIKAYEASDRTNPPPQQAILFIGSSAFRLWKSLAHDLPGQPLINRGFGGSQIADSTAFAERIIFPYHPHLIVLYAGDNDLAAGKTPDQVLADYQSFVRTVRARLPKTRIAFVSIKPSLARWHLKEKILAANHQVAALKGEGLSFIDIFSPMLGPDGNPRKELLLADGLHPNAKGYQLWASVIGPYLKD
jgi:lysophospholipase L1-like esterase